MGLLWSYYCSSLSQPTTPRHVLLTYHSTLEELPWSFFFPDLAAMDAMMKLRLMDNVASFVFLGKVFPLFDWKTIAAAYRLASVLDDLYLLWPYFYVSCMQWCESTEWLLSTSAVPHHVPTSSADASSWEANYGQRSEWLCIERSLNFMILSPSLSLSLFLSLPSPL